MPGVPTMMFTVHVLITCSIIFFCDIRQALADITAQYCEQHSVLSTDKSVYKQGDTLKTICLFPLLCHNYEDQIRFQLDNEFLLPTNTTMNDSHFTVFTEYTVHRNDNNKQLQCRVIDSSSVAVSTPLKLRVGEPPSAVDEIKCFLWSYEKMICSFWPEQQDTGLPTNYTFYWNSSYIPKAEIFPRIKCYNQEGNTCNITSEKHVFNRYIWYTVGVEVKNDLGEARNQETFDASKCVKLARIDSLDVTDRGSTGFTLSWKKPYRKYIKDNTIYEIAVSSSLDPRRVKVNVTESADTVTYNVTGLIPFFNYTVQIRSFPSSSLNNSLDPADFWSDPVIKHIPTLPDVPGASPSVTAGGFQYHRHTKHLVVYWQHIPLGLMHGKPKHYRIRMFKRLKGDSPSCNGSDAVERVVPYNHTSITETLSGLGPYDVCVDMENHMGFNESLHLTPIRVSKRELPLPKFYIRLSEDNHIEVRILNYTGADRYTLFWCESFIMSCLHKEIHWEIVNATSSTHTISTDLSSSHVVIALSAEYSNDVGMVTSSGLQYAHYLFNKASVPVQKPTDLKLVSTKAGSVVIEWTKPDKANTAYIDHFIADYCMKEECSDQKKHHQIKFSIRGDLDGTKQIEIISDFQEEKTYEICLRSVGDGKESNFTEAIKIEVPKSGLSKPSIAILYIACIIGILLAAGAIYSLIRKCRKKLIEFSQPLGVIMPNVEEQQNEKNGNATKSEGPYLEVFDDGYERIKEAQIDGEPDELCDKTELAKSEVSSATQPENMSLLNKAGSRHTPVLIQVSNGIPATGIS